MNRVDLKFREPLAGAVASLFFLMCLPLSAQQRGKAEKVVSAFPLQQVLVGEEALLNVQIKGESFSGSLNTTEESALSFRSLPADRLGSDTLALNIGVTATRPGLTTVPAFEIPLKSGTQTTDSFEVDVVSTDVVKWQTRNLGSNSHEIGTAFLFPSGPIYAGQSIPLTVKLLFPVELPIVGTGFAEIEKENIGAWRMEAPFPPNYNQRVSPRTPNAIRPREISIKGKRYQVINYTTFAAPLKEGLVTIGPGKVQGLQMEVTNHSQRRRHFRFIATRLQSGMGPARTHFHCQAPAQRSPSRLPGSSGRFHP